MTKTTVVLAFHKFADDFSSFARPSGLRPVRTRLGRFVAFGALVAAPAWAQSNTFPSSGNVGIGTTSPGSNLQIGTTTSSPTSTPETLSLGGTYSSTAGANPKLKLYDVGGAYTYGIGVSSSEMDFIVPTAAAFAFFPNGNSTAGMTIASSGNIGIANPAPVGSLDVGPSTMTNVPWVYFRNNVGWDGPLPSSSVNYGLMFGWNASGGQGESEILYGTGPGGAPQLNFGRWNGTTKTLDMTLNNGNLGIGVQYPIYPLSVKGTIGAQEVIVTSTSGWSDYVFAPDYRLAPLSEVATYVKENQHLPGIPSAAEVDAKGVSLGEMQAKLLAKIEELTLHMIEAEKENQALRDRMARVEAGAGKALAAASR